MKKFFAMLVAFVMIACTFASIAPVAAEDAKMGLTAQTYTVKGDSVTLYIVFNQDVVLGDGCSFVIAPAGLLVNPTVVDDHIVSVSNEQYPPALFVKSGYNGAPQACYIWTNAISGKDGSTLVCDDKTTVWGNEETLCLFEYAGEVNSVDELPASGTVDGGNDDAGDDNTGDDNTDSEVTMPTEGFGGIVYTVSGQPTKVYLVFNQKLGKVDPFSIVLGPAGILATSMTVVDDHIVCFENADYPLSISLKNFQGTPQECYIWTDEGLEGQNGAKLPREDKATVWGAEHMLYHFEYAGEVDSVDALPSLDDFESGDDNTGDDNTGDDNTGDDNTGSDTPAVVTPLAGKVYTVKGEFTKVYLVFNQKLGKADPFSIVLGPAGILATSMTVVDEHIVCFENVDYPLSIILKSGYNSAPQDCYIWTDEGLEGQNGAKLPKNDKVAVWGNEHSLYLFEYAGEVDSVEDLPALENNAGTGDSTMAVGAVVVVACAAALIAVSKKKRVH